LLRAKWTARIHAEWINAASRDRPDLNRARRERAAELMNSAVLAAAIHCGAQEIVTFNLRDFPETVLRPYGIRAIHPVLPRK
jgi:hypothetical protein